jgi:uncharacterized protein (UPF0332 family)
MTPESEYFLDKACKLLGDAEVMLKVDLNDAAGRTAYLAAFHAAQAFISERTGQSVKTHKGVQAELHRLTRDATGFDAELRGFLSHAYNLKAAADYETGPAAEISHERASAALQRARRFVAYFETVLAKPPPEAGTG